MTALEPLLQKAGFTDYEARAYIALLHKSPQTGYELAKTSKIPRGNIYTVLQKLESRGAATRVVTPDAMRYTAVQPTLVLQRMKDSFFDMMQDLERHMESLSAAADGQAVESFEGEENLRFFTEELLQTAKHRIVLAAHPEETGLYKSLDTCRARGISASVLCLNGCGARCQNCQGQATAVRAQSAGRWFLAVADDVYLIAGDIHGDQVTGVRTRLSLFSNLVSLYVQQCILISNLVERGAIHPAQVPAIAAATTGQS